MATTIRLTRYPSNSAGTTRRRSTPNRLSNRLQSSTFSNFGRLLFSPFLKELSRSGMSPTTPQTR